MSNEQYPLLSKIDSPQDLKKLPVSKLTPLAAELRDFLISTVSKTSGHFASGLGAVELTIALHYVFDTPHDQLIWDVGHQAYPHKILTGRRDRLQTIRQKDGLHPFLWRSESEYDVFSTGHASTSISEALGLAIANRMQKNNKKVVAVIGDGALTGGVAFEAMNHAGDLNEDILIILNDNEMSISESVGSLSKHLAMWLSSPSFNNILKKGRKTLSSLPKIKEFAIRTHEHLKGMMLPGTLFEEFGFNYVGPIDGHDIETLVAVLQNLKQIKGPRILHIGTTKGKGYQPAEENPTAYHGVPKFEVPVGVETSEKKRNTFDENFGNWLMYAAEHNEKVLGITPAMCSGSGMVPFSRKYSSRYFDVAIAEQHALLLSSGLAVGGMLPVVCVYSTFLQRAYDQIIHDLAIQDVPVVVAIDRAGVVGPDGPTHQGVFDISFIRSVPNMILMTPSSLGMQWKMLNTALSYGHPAAVRYPRGKGITDNEIADVTVEIGKGCVLKEGKDICFIVWGPLVHDVLRAVNDSGKEYSVVDMRFVKPMDEDLIVRMAGSHSVIVTLEDGVVQGGAGEEVSRIISKHYLICPVLNVGIPDEFIDQASPAEIYEQCGMDGDSVIKKGEDFLKGYEKVLNRS